MRANFSRRACRSDLLRKARGVTSQSLGNQLQKKETELGVLEVHLPDFVVRQQQQRTVLFADDGLCSPVLLGNQGQFADHCPHPERHIRFDGSKPAADHDHQLVRQIADTKENLALRHLTLS